MTLTAARTLVATVLGCVAAGVALMLTDSVAAAVIAAAVGVALCMAVAMIGPRHQTVVDRIGRVGRYARRGRRRTRNMLYSTGGIALVWDGRATAMYVALKPRPFQVSVIDVADPQLPVQHVPTGMIAKHLNERGDIRPVEINVLGAGFRRTTSTELARIYEAHVGDTPIPAILNTVIEVKVDLGRSRQSIKARAVDGSIPGAAGRATHTAAKRLEQELNVEGYEATLMRLPELRGFHASVLSALNDGLRHEKRSHLGGRQPAVLARPAEWSSRAGRDGSRYRPSIGCITASGSPLAAIPPPLRA